MQINCINDFEVRFVFGARQGLFQILFDGHHDSAGTIGNPYSSTVIFEASSLPAVVSLHHVSLVRFVFDIRQDIISEQKKPPRIRGGGRDGRCVQLCLRGAVRFRTGRQIEGWSPSRGARPET
jgi:hypothetical protein